MKPHDVKHYRCPRCKQQATVLVQFMHSSNFQRDQQGHIQYYCTHCGTTFAIDEQGKIVAIHLRP